MSFTNVFHVALVFFLFFLSQEIAAQSEYNMYVINTPLVDDRVIEFEVYIKGIDQSFDLTSYQCAFMFSPQIAEGQNLSFTYIDGTSGLSNQPSFGTGVNDLDGQSELTFASLAGSDIISVTPILVGRFRLQGTESLALTDPQITWDFEGFVSTIITGSNFQNITVPSYHTYNPVLGLTTENTEIPSQFKLFQNYPNPFNPTTKITFNLPKNSHVNLAVYNLLGQEIEIVVDDDISAGTYSFDFVGKDLSTGIYFCKLKADDKLVEIIKMILLR